MAGEQDGFAMVADILQQAAEGGWQGLENAEQGLSAFNRKIAIEERLQAENEARIVAAVLDTPAGWKLMGWLQQKTLLRGATPEELAAKTTDEYALHAARRQGQAGVFLMLLQAILTARGIKTEDVKA